MTARCPDCGHRRCKPCARAYQQAWYRKNAEWARVVQRARWRQHTAAEHAPWRYHAAIKDTQRGDSTVICRGGGSAVLGATASEQVRARAASPARVADVLRDAATATYANGSRAASPDSGSTQTRGPSFVSGSVTLPVGEKPARTEELTGGVCASLNGWPGNQGTCAISRQRNTGGTVGHMAAREDGQPTTSGGQVAAVRRESRSTLECARKGSAAMIPSVTAGPRREYASGVAPGPLTQQRAKANSAPADSGAMPNRAASSPPITPSRHHREAA